MSDMGSKLFMLAIEELIKQMITSNVCVPAYDHKQPLERHKQNGMMAA